MTPTGDHTVIYGSVCSGIEAATAAWHPLGWKPSFFSEIDAFPRAVLSHHYPEVPLHGDFTTIKAGEYRPIDLLVGGTPCQSFSIAGLRGGLGDDRGNLALEYLRLADRLRPRWLVWENVPGVLSSNGGRDFGSILGGMGELGYGVAYRVLDAQYFGVAQRRRRVFVVGYFGDWRPAAAVLFERHSLQGHPAPRRETRKDVAPTISARPTGGGGLGTDFDLDGGCVVTAPMLNATYGEQTGQDYMNGLCVAYSIMPMNSGKDYKARPVDIAQPLMASGPVGGNQGGDVIVNPLPLDTTQVTSAANRSNPQHGDPCHPLVSQGNPPAIAFSIQERAVSENPNAGPQGAGWNEERAFTLEARNKVQAVATSAVRRLTPRECERLQGFPDGFTNIPWRGKNGAPDGPRYKALGNSMAVPCMSWIGRRIEQVEAAIQETTP